MGNHVDFDRLTTEKKKVNQKESEALKIINK
jgi:hypothetical protein